VASICGLGYAGFLSFFLSLLAFRLRISYYLPASLVLALAGWLAWCFAYARAGAIRAWPINDKSRD